MRSSLNVSEPAFPLSVICSTTLPHPDISQAFSRAGHKPCSRTPKVPLQKCWSALRSPFDLFRALFRCQCQWNLQTPAADTTHRAFAISARQMELPPVTQQSRWRSGLSLDAGSGFKVEHS